MNTKRRAVLAPIHPPDGLRDELRNVHGKTKWREWAAKRCLELLVLDTFPPVSPTPDPGLIMVYLEDDDREAFEGRYPIPGESGGWRSVAAGIALEELQRIAHAIRTEAAADRVRSILAQLGPDDVEAVKARLAELEVDEELRVDPDAAP